MKVTLTVAQMTMLVDATRSRDGTVLSSGFNNAKHATNTAKALIARGYLEPYYGTDTRVTRITAAGRDVVATGTADYAAAERRDARRRAKWFGRQVRDLLFMVDHRIGTERYVGQTGDLAYEAARSAAHAAAQVLENGGRG